MPFPTSGPVGSLQDPVFSQRGSHRAGSEEMRTGGGLPPFARGQSLVVRAADASVGLTVLPVMRRNVNLVLALPGVAGLGLLVC